MGPRNTAAFRKLIKLPQCLRVLAEEPRAWVLLGTKETVLLPKDNLVPL